MFTEQTYPDPMDAILSQLTPEQIDILVREPLSEQSVVLLNPALDDAILDQIPLFRVLEAYLQILERDQKIKLTPLGALPKKVMVEVYSHRYLLDDHIEKGITKLTREYDCIAISNTRMVAEIAGLVKKREGKLTLTKNGQVLMAKNKRVDLFSLFLSTFANRFSWASNDLYTEEPVAQRGWAFTVYMLHKLGAEPTETSFYCRWYFKLFPIPTITIITHYADVAYQYQHCYDTRSFSRFLCWFGLAELEDNWFKSPPRPNLVSRTNLLEQVFVFD